MTLPPKLEMGNCRIWFWRAPITTDYWMMMMILLLLLFVFNYSLLCSLENPYVSNLEFSLCFMFR